MTYLVDKTNSTIWITFRIKLIIPLIMFEVTKIMNYVEVLHIIFMLEIKLERPGAVRYLRRVFFELKAKNDLPEENLFFNDCITKATRIRSEIMKLAVATCSTEEDKLSIFQNSPRPMIKSYNKDTKRENTMN